MHEILRGNVIKNVVLEISKILWKKERRVNRIIRKFFNLLRCRIAGVHRWEAGSVPRS
jgi:hypothetical protein